MAEILRVSQKIKINGLVLCFLHKSKQIELWATSNTDLLKSIANLATEIFCDEQKTVS